MKLCKCCGKKQPLENFTRNQFGKKRKNQCKRCIAAKTKARRLANEEVIDYTKLTNHRKPWTSEEKEYIIANGLFDSNKEIAARLKRTEQAVANMKYILFTKVI